MKTPREILSERHRSMDARLDALRKEVIAEHVIARQFMTRRAPSPRFTPSFIALKMWQELILPCRRIWLGVTAAWLVILAANLVAPGSTTRAPEIAALKTAPPNPQIMAALKEQKLWMTQMLEPAAPPTANTTVPGPRSDRRIELLVA